MQNESNIYDTYRAWLGVSKGSDADSDKSFVKESLDDIIKSPAYHTNSKRNGVIQPMIIVRVEMKKCKLTVIPGTTVNIGDIIDVFGEKWLCVELYKDEYDMVYGVLWLCNIVLKYQDFGGKIITQCAVLDNGTYAKNSNETIPVEGNYYTCYVSKNKDTNPLVVDKRLAIGVDYDNQGNEIIDVGKISWVDRTSKNYSSGSHLMIFGLKDDVYSPETDSIELMICDYKQTTQNNTSSNLSILTITGKDEIKIGTTRKYIVGAIDSNGNSIETPAGIVWEIDNTPSGITHTSDETGCYLTVNLNDELIGVTIKLRCRDTLSVYAATEKNIKVVQIG